MANDRAILARVAYLYYKEELTQQEIADEMGTSRPKVTRMLQEARRTGIVRIDIMHEIPQEQKEAYDIRRLFGIEKAVVVKTEANRTATIGSLRSAVGSLIVDELQRVSSIGFSFSQTIGNIADYLHIGSDSYHIKVCDLEGAMMGFPMPYTASADVAKRIGGAFYPISAPIMVLDAANLQTYLDDPNIRKSMEVANEVELAVVGIGDFTTQNILYRSGYINEETINNMRRQGIVGEMCMRFFDLNGARVHSELDPRVISASWEALVKAQKIIAVASGHNKIRPILGALKTGIVHTLVTDYDTAAGVLALHRQFDGDSSTA